MKRVAKILLFLLIIIGLKFLTDFGGLVNFKNFRTLSNEEKKTRYVLETEGCKIPYYDPFDPTVIEFYEKTTGDIPCEGKRYLFIVNNTVYLDIEEVENDFPGENFTCEYEAIIRNPSNSSSAADNKIGVSEARPLIIGEVVKDEFLKILCYVNEDLVHEEFLAATLLKPEVQKRCKKYSSKSSVEPKIDVLIVGMDSVSKINFQRHFNLTSEYIKNNLPAFEFHGYMKVADNTFPNLTPMLTGHFVQYYYSAKKKKMYFDKLDFIWKKYKAIGYKTLLAEDAPDMGIYNYAKYGFRYPPTDYYYRPFAYAIEDTEWQKESNKDCYQANPEIVVLLNYVRSFLTNTGKEPYFALTWPSRLTHNHLNKAGYADKVTFELLRDLNKMGIFNRSMVVFVSDHGIRFGPMRNTFIGKIEERMPFLFMTLPPWFLEIHPEIKANLEINQKRMVTPFDIYETFEHLLQIMSGKKPEKVSRYGTSLFNHISAARTCDDAYVLPHWCPCHRFVAKPTDDANVLKATKVLVQTINNWTQSHREICEILSLEVITDSLVSLPKTELLHFDRLNEKDTDRKYNLNKVKVKDNVNVTAEIIDYSITIKTLPGHSTFESTVRCNNGAYTVLDISRTSEYGHQGDCIDDFNLRKYCYCKNQL